MVRRRSVRGRQRPVAIAPNVPTPQNQVEQPVEENKPVIEEETYFLNPASVSPHLYCSICQEVFKEPYRAPCGHSYCKRCIHDWLQHNATCPADRRSLTASQLHHDFLVENIIDDYVVACPWRALGCHNVGPLHQLKQHRLVCPLNPNNMPKVLQDYSVKMLSTAQADLQKKIFEKSMQRASSNSSSSGGGGGGRASASAASSSLFDQLLSEEIQQDQQQQQQASANVNQNCNTNNTNSADNNANHNNGGNDDEEEEEEEANLPGGQPPSLRMRLYMSGRRQDGGSEIVDFLENLSTSAHLALPNSISRFCDAEPQPKRSR